MKRKRKGTEIPLYLFMYSFCSGSLLFIELCLKTMKKLNHYRNIISVLCG